MGPTNILDIGKTNFKAPYTDAFCLYIPAFRCQFLEFSEILRKHRILQKPREHFFPLLTTYNNTTNVYYIFYFHLISLCESVFKYLIGR